MSYNSYRKPQTSQKVIEARKVLKQFLGTKTVMGQNLVSGDNNTALRMAMKSIMASKNGKLQRKSRYIRKLKNQLRWARQNKNIAVMPYSQPMQTVAVPQITRTM